MWKQIMSSKLVKGLLASKLVKGLLANKLLAGGLAALLALLAIFLLVWKKRRAARAGGSGINADSLLKVWRRFLEPLPRSIRSTAAHYPAFLVLGQGAAGKSQLIGQYTGWQGQARQFCPSYTEDPNLQIYLGSKAVAIELDVSILNDSSPVARKALSRLLRRVFRRRSPVAVLVIHAEDLAKASPDSLKVLAETLRGKLNLLAELRGRPAEARVVLTHMDRFDGFSELSGFLRDRGMSSRIDLGGSESAVSARDLSKAMDGYAKLLPALLTDLEGDHFKRALGFLNDAPGLLKQVESFHKILTDRQPLSIPPNLSQLYLVSSLDSPQAANPFAAPPTAPVDVEPRRRLQRHKLAAVSVAVLGLTYLLGSFLYEKKKLSVAEAGLATFERSGELSRAEEIHDLIEDFEDREDLDPYLPFLPAFFFGQEQALEKRFSAINSKLKRKLTDKIREHTLLPALAHLLRADRCEQKTLYMLALLYATRENELGKLVLSSSEQWAQLLDLPEAVVVQYVKCSDAQYQAPVDLGDPREYEDQTPESSRVPWLVYFSELQTAIQQQELSQNQLSELKSDTQPLLAVIANIKQFKFSRRIYQLLLDETDLPLKTVYGQFVNRLRVPDWIGRNARTIDDLLHVVVEADLATPPAGPLNFRHFINNLKVLGKKLESADTFYSLTLADTDFSFSKATWEELIWRSRLRIFCRSFVDAKKQDLGSLFFSPHSTYQDVVMNPSNSGRFLFTGKATISGRFTKPAYMREVRPTLEDFDGLLKTLPLSTPEAENLKNFVYAAVQEYAGEYKRQVLAYYHAYGVEVSSLGALNIVLRKLQLLASPLHDFLSVIKTNTALDYGKSVLYEPLAKELAEFRFVDQLLSDSTAVTELASYTAILAQIERELGARKPAAKGKAASKPAAAAAAAAKSAANDDFFSQLSPAGNMAYAILAQSPSSYEALVNQWLENVGITEDYRHPFQAPVLGLYALGLGDLERSVASHWSQTLSVSLDPVLSLFPFDPDAERSAGQKDLEALFLPTGSFWRDFQKLVGPVCTKVDGVYAVRNPKLQPLRLPKDMLPTVNALSHLSRILWDEHGNPQPLSYFARPRPLVVIAGAGKPAVVLSYLTVSDGSVFGFNQEPAWIPIYCKWWEFDTSSVGIQILDPSTGTKSYRELTVSNSNWSLYRLLKKGEGNRDGLWTWRLKDKAPEKSPIAVFFEVRGDPWKIFDIRNL